jgi:hypothetical protein
VIYPNPFSSEISANLRGFEGNLDISVFNVNGQLMYSASRVLSSSDSQILIKGLAKWPKGIYIVNFVSDSFTISRKITK